MPGTPAAAMLPEGHGYLLHEHTEAIQLVIQVVKAGGAGGAVGKAVAVATAAGVAAHTGHTMAAQALTSALVTAGSALCVTLAN